MHFVARTSSHTEWGSDIAPVLEVQPGFGLLAGEEGPPGDPARQGDGEVCGTAVETASQVTVRVSVDRGRAPRTPRVLTASVRPVPGRRVVTTGIGPGLKAAAADATLQLVDEIMARSGRSAAAAYALASVAADLEVSELVDAPNWVIAAVLALDYLER